MTKTNKPIPSHNIQYLESSLQILLNFMFYLKL